MCLSVCVRVCAWHIVLLVCTSLCECVSDALCCFGCACVSVCWIHCVVLSVSVPLCVSVCLTHCVVLGVSCLFV